MTLVKFRTFNIYNDNNGGDFNTHFFYHFNYRVNNWYVLFFCIDFKVVCILSGSLYLGIIYYRSII